VKRFATHPKNDVRSWGFSFWRRDLLLREFPEFLSSIFEFAPKLYIPNRSASVLCWRGVYNATRGCSSSAKPALHLCAAALRRIVLVGKKIKMNILAHSLRNLPGANDGFSKVLLSPGEKKSVTFILHARDLAYYDPESSAWRVEPVLHQILVGGSSRPADLLQATFGVTDSRNQNHR
jgi:hypothetical protein